EALVHRVAGGGELASGGAVLVGEALDALLPRGVSGGGLAAQRDELIGDSGHRGDDDDLARLGARAKNVGDPANAGGVTHAGAAEFVSDGRGHETVSVHRATPSAKLL